MKRKSKGVTPSFPDFAPAPTQKPPIESSNQPAKALGTFLPGLSPSQTGVDKAAASRKRWQAIYDDYLKTETWQSKRRAVLKRAGGRCDRCGRECADLTIHHRNYLRFGGGELLSDLEALCPSPCHIQADKERRAERDDAMQAAEADAEERAAEQKFARWMDKKWGEDWELKGDAFIEEQRDRFEALQDRRRERESSND